MTDSKAEIGRIIGQRINTLLATNDVKQIQLAKALGLSEKTANTISYFCAGKRIPTYDQLIKIADFFGVSVDSLLGRNNQETETDVSLLVSDYTGISPMGLKKLRKCNQKEILSNALEEDSFYLLMDEIESFQFYLGELARLIGDFKRARAGYGSAANAEILHLPFLSEYFRESRLEKYEVRDRFYNLLEKMIPSAEILSEGKAINDWANGKAKRLDMMEG